jgi:hypothetical protein
MTSPRFQRYTNNLKLYAWSTLSADSDRVELMAGPFRYRKKERRRWRQSAKKQTELAEKLETKGATPEIVAVCRRMADFSGRLSLARHRKKKPSSSS